MNKKRKQIIISEIKYWKENKLLPTHYCDFLITLYAQGEEDDLETNVSQSIIRTEKKRLTRAVIFLSLLATGVSAGLFIFTSYPIITLGLSCFVLSLLLIMAVRGTKENQILLHFYTYYQHLCFS